MFWPMTLTHRLDNVVNRMLTAIHASMSAQQASTMGMFPAGTASSSTRAENSGPHRPATMASACSTNARRNRRPSRRMYTKQRRIISQLKVLSSVSSTPKVFRFAMVSAPPLPGRLPRARRAFPARPAAGRCRGNSPHRPRAVHECRAARCARPAIRVSGPRCAQRKCAAQQ